MVGVSLKINAATNCATVKGSTATMNKCPRQDVQDNLRGKLIESELRRRKRTIRDTRTRCGSGYQNYNKLEKDVARCELPVVTQVSDEKVETLSNVGPSGVHDSKGERTNECPLRMQVGCGWKDADRIGWGQSRPLERAGLTQLIEAEQVTLDLDAFLLMGESASPNSTLNLAGLFALWYFSSFITLFSNKYILLDPKNDAVILGCFQMLMCTICGYFHVKVPIGISQDFHKKSRRVSKTVVIVGSLRFVTILFGLVTLWYSPVSFAETVKSSAPIFTVVLSYFVLRESCNPWANLSLVPIVLGLFLCSAYELSFTSAALASALATNLSECFQSVYSKKLLSVERFEPHHLQFYTSAVSIIVQIPSVLLLANTGTFIDTATGDSNYILSYILNGFSFHCQSLTEYILLKKISPVTFAVGNTAKRALLILLSVKIFGNQVTIQSWIGTFILFVGVYCYNRAVTGTQSRQSETQINTDDDDHCI